MDKRWNYIFITAFSALALAGSMRAQNLSYSLLDPGSA